MYKRQELGIPHSDVTVEEGDTDTAPYGLGTYASRSTPTAGAAAAMACRKIKDKAQKIAAHLLEASEEDVLDECESLDSFDSDNGEDEDFDNDENLTDMDCVSGSFADLFDTIED